MKKILSFIALFVVVSTAMSQENHYYWYKGAQKNLEVSYSKQYVTVRSLSDAIQVEQDLSRQGITFQPFQKMSLSNYFETEDTLYWTFIYGQEGNALYTNQLISYSAPSFQMEDGLEVGLSNFFYVKLKNEDDVELLRSVAVENGASILGNDRFMPLWYTLTCTEKTTSNALELANLFYEMNLFELATPNFIVENIADCVNDSLFSMQWGLENTGQYSGVAGTDINYCTAAQITTGSSSVIVAVLDHGVQLNHPDLTNIYPLSYDTYYSSSPSQLWGDHGTKCAGIIGANANNSKGVAGIAPNCPIMSISHPLLDEPLADVLFVNGINFAVTNGASVISNSWHYYENDYIENAINNALTNGRNGKGCVVVAAAGNANVEAVNFPARLEGVIAVGGISPSGEHLSPTSNPTGLSSYGQELDLVAPGVNVPTTDINSGYVTGFNGTSSACPHVAAAAALVLSVNPGLTYEEVKEVLCRTATRVGPYTYSIDTTHLYGTWYKKTGYGLVNVGEAVIRAQAMNSHADLFIRDNVGDTASEPNLTTTTYTNSPDIWLTKTDGSAATQLYEGQSYLVHVRVHNADTMASQTNIKVRLNWARIHGNMNWANAWNGSLRLPCLIPRSGLIGTQTISSSIVSGGDVVVTFSWTIPVWQNGSTGCPYLPAGSLWDYSLIARVDDSLYTHGIDQTNYNIDKFVKINNNVARKNITLTQNNNPDPPIVIGRDGFDSTSASLHMGGMEGSYSFGKDVNLSIYPNPTDGLLTVEYNLEEDSHVDVSVYDMSGVVRQTLSQGEMRKGFNSEKHNVSRLPNGIYVVKVTIDGVSYTHKMIKQ